MVSDGMPHIDDPRTIREASFSTSFRGFDQLEVRAFLQTLARQLTDIDDLRADAQAKVDQAQQELEAASEIDESVLMARLGEDATRILQTARDSASERLAQADQDIADLRARVDTEAEAIRSAAEEQAKQLQAELDTKRATLDANIATEQQLREQHRSEAFVQAERDAEDLVATARAQGDQVLADAREEGRAMVAEARIVRERILSDLSRRRTNAKVQLEQLRAGRQRLVEAIELASTAVGEVNRELDNSLPEARLAAETAGLTVPVPASAAEIESEIESARLVGNPFVTSDEVQRSLNNGTGSPGEEQTAETLLPPSPNELAQSVEASVEEHQLAEAVGSDVPDDPEFDSPGLVLAELGDDRSAMFRRKKNLPPVADELPRDVVPTIEPEADFEQVRALDPTIELLPVTDESLAEPEQPVPTVLEEPEPVVEVEAEEQAASAEEDQDLGVEEPVEVTVDEEVEDSAEGSEEEDVEAVEDGGNEVAEQRAAIVALVPEVPEGPAEVEETTDLAQDTDEPVEDIEVAELVEDIEVAELVEDIEVVELVEDVEVVEPVEDESPPEDEAVDALFERLRADRKQRTAQASAVLAAAESVPAQIPEESEPAATLEPEPAPEPEPVPTPEPQIAPALEAVPELVDVAVPATSERFQNLEHALAERRASLAELEKSVSRKLKRSLAEEQNELLDLVRRSGDRSGSRSGARAALSADNLLQDVLGNSGAHCARYVGAVEAQLQTAAAAGASSVGGQAPSIDLGAAGTVMADELLSSMRLLLERVIADGEDEDDIIEHLRSLYREVKGQRMTAVASSLVVVAYNVGVHAGLAAERTVRWELAPDSECGEDCTANLMAGVITAGNAFPSGHLHPPAASGCRCLLVAEGDVQSKKIS